MTTTPQFCPGQSSARELLIHMVSHRWPEALAAVDSWVEAASEEEIENRDQAGVPLDEDQCRVILAQLLASQEPVDDPGVQASLVDEALEIRARHTSCGGGGTAVTTTIADAQERLLEAIAVVVHQVDDLVDVVPTRHAPAIQLLEDLASRILESVRINDSIAGQELRGWLFDLNQAVDLLKG